MNPTPPNVCDRQYSGATTAKLINGLACCPSCNLPIADHGTGVIPQVERESTETRPTYTTELEAAIKTLITERERLARIDELSLGIRSAEAASRGGNDVTQYMRNRMAMLFNREEIQ